MPQIREYVSQTRADVPFNPQKSRAEDFANTAGLRRVAQGLSSLGQAITERETQSDYSNIAVQISQAQADFANQLREGLRTADPGDKTFADKFIQKYDDQMSKVSESIETRAGHQYFERASASLRSHLLRSAAAGQAELAGTQAKQNYVTSLNNYSSSLVNDPSSFDAIKQQHDAMIQNLISGGGLSTEMAAKLKTEGTRELAKSAVRGWIELNPEDAKQQLKEGRWNQYIDGDQVRQLNGEADQAIRAKEIDRLRADQDQKRALKLKQGATQNEFLQKLTSHTLTAKDILKSDLDPFGSGSKDQFLRMLKAGESQTDPAVFNDLFARIHAPDGDPDKITDESELNQYKVEGKISYSDLNHLRQEMEGGKSESGKQETQMKKLLMNAAKSRLVNANPMTGIKDPVGEENLLRWTIWFNNAYAAGRKAGKSSQDLLDPGSKDYLGRGIQNFVRTPTQIMQDMTKMTSTRVNGSPSNGSSSSGGVGVNGGQEPVHINPRKSGESPADYLKRIGSGK